VADIFISYTASDRRSAVWIANELETLGHTPRIHDFELYGGEDVYAWMRRDTADPLLCVLSHAYLTVAAPALERRLWPTGSRHPLIFVLVEPCELPALSVPFQECRLFGIGQDIARALLRSLLGEAPGSAASRPAYSSTVSSLHELARLRANARAAPAGLELLSAGAETGAGRRNEVPEDRDDIFQPSRSQGSTQERAALQMPISPEDERWARHRAEERRLEAKARHEAEEEEHRRSVEAKIRRAEEAAPKVRETQERVIFLAQFASHKPWAILIALGVVAVGGWLLRRQIADLAHTLFGWFGLSSLPPTYVATSVVPPPPAPEDAVSDAVDISAFAPVEAVAGEEALVQIYLHQFDQGQLATTRAQRADPDAAERDTVTLATNVCRGQTVDVILEASGLTIEEPHRSIVWRGKPDACKFLVAIPGNAAGRSFSFRVRVLLGSVPIGQLLFKLKVATAPSRGAADDDAPPSYRAGLLSSPENRRPDAGTAMVGDVAKRYRHAFLSYTEADRAEVLRAAQLLRAAGLSIFQDIISAVPGERWEPKIFQEIDKCDLFLLFWSHAAANSQWVLREAEHAITCQEKNLPDEVPDIRPVVLCDPPIPEPPEALRHINFNDHVCYLITAIKGVERRQHA
jgi:hypothetical protein